MKHLNYYNTFSINEGKRVKLDNQLIEQIDDIIDNLIPKKIAEDFMEFDKGYGDTYGKILVDIVYYRELDKNRKSQLSEDEESICKVFIELNDFNNYSATYRPKDTSNRKDNEIYLNLIQLEYKAKLPKEKLWVDRENKAWKKENSNELIKLYNQTKEYWRDILVHEFTHAVDPACNSKEDKVASEKYKRKDIIKGKDIIKDYLSHNWEILANSTSFFNRIIRTANYIGSGNVKDFSDKFRSNLDLLLKFFNTTNFHIPNKKEFLSILSGVINEYELDEIENFFKLINGEKNEELLHKIAEFDRKESYFLGNIIKILMFKKHNQKAWKSFLTKLYNTIEEAKEIVNKKISGAKSTSIDFKKKEKFIQDYKTWCEEQERERKKEEEKIKNLPPIEIPDPTKPIEIVL